MPRIFRLLPETGILHILTRGNNRQQVFKDNADYKRYLELLKLYKSQHRFLLYHYCLMPNHVHLIIETTPTTNLAKLMKQINLAYMHYYRKRYTYFGHFWQGRYKSLIIDKDEYLIACGRYIELNPVRAKIVKEPEDYRYSSYNLYAHGREDGLADLDPLYVDLGKTTKRRQENYRKFVQEGLPMVNLNSRFMGSKSFICAMEGKFNIKNLKDARGRPKKVEK